MGSVFYNYEIVEKLFESIKDIERALDRPNKRVNILYLSYSTPWSKDPTRALIYLMPQSKHYAPTWRFELCSTYTITLIPMS